jgi:hypothetical protein
VNATALVNGTALVNEQGDPVLDATALVNKSFMISQTALGFATALVNGQLLTAPALAFATALVNETTIVNGTALVNATALVNGTALVNSYDSTGNLLNATALVNGTALVNATALVNSNTINESSNSGAVVILDESDVLILSGDSTGNVELSAINLVTRNTVGEGLIVPGTFLSNNFNVSYGLGNLTIQPDTAQLSFVGATLQQTYDGQPKAPQVNILPDTLGVLLTFNGDTAAPTEAGVYEVVATVADTNFVGSVTGTMTILPATATVELVELSLTQTYTGSPLSPSVVTDPTGLPVELAFDSSSAPPANVGTYSVIATIDDPNYTGEDSATFKIVPAAAQVLIDPASLSQPYDGSPKTVNATTSPGGLDLVITYNGSTTAPFYVGSYAVVVTVDDPNYTGTASGTLTITAVPATVTIDPSSLVHTYDGTVKSAVATTDPPGLPVVFNYSGLGSFNSTPLNAGFYWVTASIDDPNFPATDDQFMRINRVLASVTADSAYMAVGDPTPAFNATYSGFINGDDESVVTYEAFWIFPYYNGLPGVYNVYPFAYATNYIFSPTFGKLFVNPSGPGTEAIEVSLICVDELSVPDPSGFTYIATFGYENNNAADVYILEGADNDFSGTAAFNGAEQPEKFLSGGGTFQVPFDGNDLTWSVSSHDGSGSLVTVSVTADSTSSSCTKDSEANLQGDGIGQVVNNGLVAYPNPFNHRVTIAHNLPGMPDEEHIRVFDLSGRICEVKDIRPSDGLVEIDMTGMESGIYFIQVIMADRNEMIKVIKH